MHRVWAACESAKLNTDETFLWLTQSILVEQLNNTTTYLSTPCGNYTIQSQVFAALIRQSKPSIIFPRLTQAKYHQITQKNSEILSSEKLNLLLDKHLLTFFLHSSYSSSRMYGHTIGRPA